MFHLKDAGVMELADDVFASVERYYNTLENTGYIPDKVVFKLLAFMFMEEILYGKLSGFITEKDYNSINKALDCLYGTCMIPFPDYKKGVDSVAGRLLDEFRYTEDNIIRNTEDSDLRVKA